MIKKIIFLTLLFSSLPSLSHSQEDDQTQQRYRYDSAEKVMVDRRTGKIYRFVLHGGVIKHVEVDYVHGTVRPKGTLRGTEERELLGGLVDER